MVQASLAWRNGLAAVTITSIAPLFVMLPLAANEARVRRVLPALVAFAAGALLGAAAFHLIPEAFARNPGRPRFVVAVIVVGCATFALVGRALHTIGKAERTATRSATVAPPALLLVGDALHNLVDGILVGASFLADPSLGVLTAVAVGVHELPREIGTFGLFVQGGVSVRSAIALNLVTGVLAIGGAAAALAIGTHASVFAHSVLPFAAGNFLYLTFAVLRPTLRGSPTARALLAQAGMLILGLLLTGASAFLE